jgi:hypothetical protein
LKREEPDLYEEGKAMAGYLPAEEKLFSAEGQKLYSEKLLMADLLENILQRA